SEHAMDPRRDGRPGHGPGPGVGSRPLAVRAIGVLPSGLGGGAGRPVGGDEPQGPQEPLPARTLRSERRAMPPPPLHRRQPLPGSPRAKPALLHWKGSALEQLARAAYEQRLLPSGHLAPDRLAVLADALEAAGCTDPDILEHLRGPGPHVRGCWALDRLLGKE